jgi:CRISPR/Cas system-associated exonuclease Cas4 (RecB family)
MADLSFLQQQPGTLDAINLWYESQREPRHHLGLSQAGHSCPRYLWYRHHGYQGKPIEGRVLRLFQLGNDLEDRVVADLRACGFSIHHQQREVVFKQGDFRLVGHIDGIIEGLIESAATPHLFECKSASKKKFDELVKLGDYRKWNEIYYWQTQFYMLGLKLKRAAVFVYCKDDSRMYMERIKIDKEATVERMQWIFDSITQAEPPERKCKRADAWDAKWCDFYSECFSSAVCGVQSKSLW